MNSREKGKRGERAWRDELRANGYCARRGQQFSGSAESPDVVCEDLPAFHFEVKAVRTGEIGNKRTGVMGYTSKPDALDKYNPDGRDNSICDASAERPF